MSQEINVYEELDYRNLADAVFIKLKEQILNGTLKPEQKLKQTELSEKYGVSRAPVRDALRKLEAEGLATVNRTGTIVSSISLDEFRQLYQIREVLEDLAARKAAPNISDETLMTLTDLLKKMEQASREGDSSFWLELDFKFHNDSYKSCNSPNLLKIITGLWNSTHYIRRTYFKQPGEIERAERTHRSMLEALAARDGKLYSRLVRKHIRQSLHIISNLSSTVSSASPESP